jgi:hypothetical protein
MDDEAVVSVLASALHRAPREEALATVETHFGPASEWASALTKYRLASDFQADWKEEVGHWLTTAARHGYLEALLRRVLRMAKANAQVQRDGNDKGHAVLHAELAAALAAHYLLGTGWSYVAWEAVVGGAVDVDIRLGTPGDGTEADFQVKGSDVPGRIEDGRVVDGEYDERVLAAIDHAASQLPRDGSRPTFVVMNAFRNWPLSATMSTVTRHLVGATTQEGDILYIRREARGRFFEDSWSHVTGVMVLDLLRGAVETRYACCVVLNPRTRSAGRESWFPHARVCTWDGRAFRWSRGEPPDCTLRDGTIVEE